MVWKALELPLIYLPEDRNIEDLTAPFAVLRDSHLGGPKFYASKDGYTKWIEYQIACHRDIF